MSRGAPTVLIVERDDALRRDLSRAVRSAGYDVKSAAEREPAARLLDSRQFEAVVIEVEQPADLQLIELALGQPSLQAVVATGSGLSVELVVEVMKLGAANFLRKPFPIGVLEESLRRTIARPLPRAAAFETRDPKCEQLLRDAAAAAVSDVTLLIVGEGGTGKESLARSIHQASRRASAPFVVVDCATLEERSAQREFFGPKRGKRGMPTAGKVARPDRGTLLLRGVGELSLALQSLLLRALEDIDGSWQAAEARRAVGARFVATSRSGLCEDVASGRFRRDLFYRLGVVVLRIPPLRERQGDIPLLAERFAQQIAQQAGCEPPRLGEAELQALAALPLRGNARELENLMRRAVLLFPGERVDLARLLVGSPRQPSPRAESDLPLNLRELERQAILRSLKQHGGNRTHASHALGISVRTLRNKIRSYGFQTL